MDSRRVLLQDIVLHQFSACVDGHFSFIKCIPLFWHGRIGVSSVGEIILSCGQEVSNICDNIQLKIKDSVSVLCTNAGGAGLASGTVNEVGVECS